MRQISKYFLLVLVFQFCFGQLTAQSSYDRNSYNAFMKNSGTLWQKSINSYKQQNKLNSNQEKIKLIHLYYAYTAHLIATKQTAKANEMIKAAESEIESILKNNSKHAEALNYKGVFLGYRAGLNKVKAPIYGRESLKYLNQAIELSPNNPQILFDKGNSLYYVPKIFGGNKGEALQYFNKTIDIFEKVNKTKYNWLYAQSLFLKGRCHELLGESNSAKQTYEKIARVAPEFNLHRDKNYSDTHKGKE